MVQDNTLLIISCEHASAHVPAEYHAVFFDEPEILSTHFAYDIGAITVAKQCARLASFTCYSPITRLLIDFNRSLRHPHVFSRFSRRLSLIDREDLKTNYYQPYRENIVKHIEQGIAQGRRILHISVHSFTPLWQDELRPAEIGLLYDPRRVHELAFAKQWYYKLHEMQPNWRIRRNYPYRGVSDGITTWLRKQFSTRQYVGLELEINQALLADAVSQQNVADLIYHSLV